MSIICIFLCSLEQDSFLVISMSTHNAGAVAKVRALFVKLFAMQLLWLNISRFNSPDLKKLNKTSHAHCHFEIQLPCATTNSLPNGRPINLSTMLIIFVTSNSVSIHTAGFFFIQTHLIHSQQLFILLSAHTPPPACARPPSCMNTKAARVKVFKVGTQRMEPTCSVVLPVPRSASNANIGILITAKQGSKERTGSCDQPKALTRRTMFR